MIKANNLIVEYDILDKENNVISKKKAIDNLTFSIEEGEFICIVGENGSGKSTLIKTFNSLILPTSGDIYVMGMNTKDEDKILEIRKNVGMTFQNPDNQIVSSIVEEDVAFGLENLGIEPFEIRKRIDEAMKILSIYDIKDSLTSKLSGGQKQKVSLAGILAMKSKIIVLDEPTSMIDKKGRNEFIKELIKLNKEYGITIILITHYMEEIVYSNRVFLLNKGKIVFDGNYKDLFLNNKLLEDNGLELPYIPRLASVLKTTNNKIIGNEINIDDLISKL